MALPDRARSDVNYKKTLIAVSNADGETPVSLWADPLTHQLLVGSTGGGSGTQYTQGGATVTNPTGTASIYFDASNNPKAVTVVQGLPTANESDNSTTGTIVANGGTVNATVASGMAGWTMSYYGTYATGASLTMEASYDNFVSSVIPVRMLQVASGVLGYVVTIAAVVNSSSAFTADIPAGATQLRVRCTAWAAPTGTINIVLAQAVERFASPVATQAVTVSAITAGSITPVPLATSTGLLTFFASAQLATVTAIKVSSGRLHNYNVSNPNATDAYLQFFDLATGSVTLGTTPPKASYRIPASGVWDGFWEFSLAYATAISVAATTTATGSAAPGTGLLVNLGYI